jgi:DNA-binding response OmpR family regulator
MKLLIVEDNEKLLGVIKEALSAENFLCEVSANYADANEKLYLYDYDCLVVDINLPDGSGLDLIRECKTEKPRTGIIVISARNSLDNKIEGLDLGADDYLTKPFDIAELIARVKSIIRRRNFEGNNTIIFEKLTIDTKNRSVTSNEQAVKLTKIEYNILLFFLANPKRVLTKESIAEHVWGDNMDLADSFDFIYSHIKNLKKKMAATGYKIPLNTVYGIGYKWENK